VQLARGARGTSTPQENATELRVPTPPISERQGLAQAAVTARVPIVGLQPGLPLPSDTCGGSVLARAVKRTIDLVSASILLILTAPLSVVVAGLIKLEDGRPGHLSSSARRAWRRTVYAAQVSLDEGGRGDLVIMLRTIKIILFGWRSR
jgi:hypothetical protein